jgi:hypothetical protein
MSCREARSRFGSVLNRLSKIKQHLGSECTGWGSRRSCWCWLCFSLTDSPLLRVEMDRRGRSPGDLIQINEPAGGHGSHDAGDADRAARRAWPMCDRSRPLLDSEAVYTVVGVIGFGILPIVLAIAMLFFS